MQSYRIYRMDHGGHVLKADFHLCKDDLDALDRARTLSVESEIEVWQGTRRVALIKKGNADLNERDRQSL